MKNFFLRTIFLGLSIILIFSCSEEKKVITEPSAFVDYVQMYSNGVLAKNDVIRITLVQPIDPNKIDWLSIKNEILSITPSIQGEVILDDNNTIIFEPSSSLHSGEKYNVSLSLKMLYDVKKELEEFSFSFEVIPQNFDVNFKGIETDVENPSLVNIKAAIDFADLVSKEEASSVVTAKLGKENLEITWEESKADKRYFNFKIEGISREDVVQDVTVSWDGSSIGVDNLDKKIIEIPALGDFSLLTSRVVTTPNYYLSLNFSDALDANQNLDGLIEIEGSQAELRFEVEANEVKVYVPENFDANKTVLVHSEVKNVFGKQIGKTIEAHVIFEQVKPEVRFVGHGSILPSSQGLVLPFEAISLKAVDVRIKRVYANNTLQFFQVNEYEGTSQMNRVGEVVFKKVIPLNGDGAINLNSWNRFTLNLDELIKKEDGAIYHVEIGFRRHQSLYLCDDAAAQKNVDENSQRYWDKFDRYIFDYNYKWNERQMPCKSAYYGHDRTVQKNILASDIGLIAKKAEDGEIKFFVTDLKTTDSISGAKVELYSYQQQVIESASTDSEGTCSFRLNKKPYIVVASYGNQKTYLKINGEASLSLSNFEVGGQNVKKGIKGLIYSERGVWRPGDSLFLSLIVEDKQGLLPSGQPVVFELNNPRGQLVERRVVTENVNGIYNFLTKTGDDAPTGTWNLKAKVGGTAFHKSLKIETIKPNRLKINLDFGEDVLTYEDKELSGKLNVKWLHGAKGSNMKAEFDMKLKKGRLKFKEFEGFTFHNPHASFSSEEFEIFNGKTDEEGNATIEAEIKLANNVPPRLNAVFTGKVYEPSGNFSISYQSIPYYPYQSMVGVRVEGADKTYSFLETDEKHHVDIACVDAKGKGVTRENVSVKLYKLKWRWWWDYNSGRSNYNSSYDNEHIASGKVNVVNGRGNWDFKVDYSSWGRYLIEVKDPVSGHVSGRIFYIDWPYWRGSSKKGMSEGASMLQLSAEKETYNIGEEVKIKVPTTEGGNVLVSLETGSRILKTYWVKATAKVTEVNFMVDKTMTPNIYANIMVLQPHMQSVNDLPIRMYGVIPIMVEDPATKLKPSIEMPKVLEPLKEVNIAIKEENGKAMTFTIAVVDEGLLDLTNFKTPKPWSHFYAKEALGVRTWDMFDDVLGAYAGDLQRLLAIGGDMSKRGEKDNKVKRFKPVVKYFGPYYLQAGTTKNISFEMPNYVGSVRTMVIAAHEGAYGSIDETTPVRQPLMVLATMPRVLAPGEVVDVPVSVFATDKSIKNATIKLESNDQLEVIGATSRSISFDKPGEQLVLFKVRATDRLGNAHVQISGSGNGKKSIHKIDLEVRSPNPPIVKVYDKLLGLNENWDLAVANVGVKGTNKLTLEVSTLPSMNLENRLRYLIRYPHGCVEQTTSGAFPQLYLNDIATLTDKQRDKVKSNIEAAINRLYSFKTSQGGLGYWPGSEKPSAWGTNYAMHFLILAKQNGYFVQENFLNQAVKYMQREARNFSNKYNYQKLEQAYRLYVLALAGKTDFSAMNRLASATKLSNVVRYRLASAYAVLNKLDMASKLLEGVTNQEVDANEDRWRTYGSDLRDKSMALETLVLMDRKEESFSLLKDIAEEFASDRWLSTQTTAFGLYAYAKYAKDNVTTNNTKVRYQFDGSSAKELFGEKSVLRKSLDASKKSSHDFNFTNTGGQIVYVKVYAEGIPLEPDEESSASKINLKVWYTDKSGARINESEIKQGTEFIAHMKVINEGFHGHYRNLALTQVIPSGWEIRNTRLNEGSTSADRKTNYVDIRDDRIMLYFNLNKSKSKQFDFEMHATFTGSFSKPPITVSAMYDNTIKAQVAGGKVKVVK